MKRRFVTIWFPYLKTDWFTRRQAKLRDVAFVLSIKDHNRVIVSAANYLAEKEGIAPGMTVADARAIYPRLKVIDDDTELNKKLLTSIGKYCIRYTPITAIDLPDGIILDATGCSHLWGSERSYTDNIINRFKKLGYHVNAAMADTIGAAWAITHFGNELVIEKGQQQYALLNLPTEALRLAQHDLDLLYSLGLRKIQSFINMPASILRRRFGNDLIHRLHQALGYEEEKIQPIEVPEPFHERLACPENISTHTGIEIALQTLLDKLCQRLQSEQKGLRKASFQCYRIDGKVEKIEIGTNKASHNSQHLFKLFEIKTETIEPGLGIELFTLDGYKIEELKPVQEKLWSSTSGLESSTVAELLDRISNKIGENPIQRFIPAEHYWPERSFKKAESLNEKMTTTWKTDKPRPVQILSRPELIEVTAPVPDYPPMLFRYRNKLHRIKKADGPERIEREWWIEEGLHRDYYVVEDEEGNRYWIFRLGHYTNDEKPEWFIHGFFA